MQRAENAIRLTKVSENNLKNIDVEIPYNKHTVIAGVSGSGKSTLAYDVIYAAAQQKLLHCMSDGEKIFHTKIKSPKVESIEGLSTVISLKQIKPNHNPRSTVGTFTNIASGIRSLMALYGQCLCPCCDKIFSPSSLSSLIRDMEGLPDKTTAEVGFPYFFTRRNDREQQIESLRKQGFRFVYVGGERLSLRDFININEADEFIFVVENRFQTSATLTKSDINCLKNAASHGDRYFFIHLSGTDTIKIQEFYKKHGCEKHHFFASTFEPSDFSYNHISCACAECMGSGTKKITHPLKVIKNSKKTLQQGVFYPDIYSMNHPYSYMSLYSLACHYDFPFDIPYEELSKKAKNLILYGTGEDTFLLKRPIGYDKPLPNYLAKEGQPIRFQGILTRLEELYEHMLNDPAPQTPAQENFFKTYMHEIPCPACNGTRLKKIRNYTLLAGKNYAQLGKMEFSQLHSFLDLLPQKNESLGIISILKEELTLMEEIGLGYLSFDRRIDSLSGGEYQRLRIASQVGSGLVGLTYIIDEPTDGLHGANTKKILAVIDQLLQKGSTVITIEHNLDILRAADYIIELGPGAGKNGGKVIATGTPKQLAKNPNSLIGKYLFPRPGKNKISNIPPANDSAKIPEKELCGNNPNNSFIKIFDVEANNLKNIDIRIPLGKITCFTGVSGSGKSSAVFEVLYKALCAEKQKHIVPGKYREIQGSEQIKDIICIDQAPPIGKSTSTPATYLDLFDSIRTLFSECIKSDTKDKKSYFSFHSKGGCPECRGKGYLEKYIPYFGETKIICPACNGQQYIEEVLDIKYRGKNIKQVLDMPFAEALEFFDGNKNILEKLKLSCDLGLGYMELGQPMNTLSGGEIQRIKLAREMTRCRSKKDLLYILDEPTIGLHKLDVAKILSVMQRVVKDKNTIVLVEHHPEMILNSDYIIDLGPGGGWHGGEIIFEGTPSQMLAEGKTKTANYLREYLRTTEIFSGMRTRTKL